MRALKYPGGDQQHAIYDSRAAVYEKMGKRKEALRDAKQVIELAKDQWQGYARAARLFLVASKFDAALSMVDAAISRLKVSNTKRCDELIKLKNDILQQRKAETKRLRLTQNQTSKLPVELLSEVFRYVVLDDLAALICLLRVSGTWRNVVLTTPSLWETLILTTRSPARKLTLWLKQSKCRIHALHIRASVTTHPDWPFPELADIAWDQIRICSSVGWDVANYVKQRKLGEDALSSLEELEMIEDRFCQQRARPGLFPLLQKVGIRSLSFSQSYFSWKDVSGHLTSLTSINVLGCSKDPQDLLAALAANPGLETIKILDHFHYRYSSTPPINLPHLTHLELMGSYASSLVESMNTPILNTLIIKGSGTSLNNAFGSLITSQCAPHLTHLVIERCSLDSSMLKRFLTNASSLTQLELLGLHKSVNAVIDALAGPTFFPRQPNDNSPSKPVVRPAGFNGTFILCPALSCLAVSQSLDVKTGPIVRLVKSRKSAAAAFATAQEGFIEDVDGQPPQKCAPITSLIMDQCDQIEANWLPWFRENVTTVSCVYESRKKKGSWREPNFPKDLSQRKLAFQVIAPLMQLIFALYLFLAFVLTTHAAPQSKAEIISPKIGETILAGSKFAFEYRTRADYGVSSYNYTVWLFTKSPATPEPSDLFATGYFFGRYSQPNYPGNPYPKNQPPSELTMPDFSKSPGGFGTGLQSENKDCLFVVLEEYGTGVLDFYELLSIPQNASPSEIKIAYHRTLLRFHPDKKKNADSVPNSKGNESISISVIKEAYNTLSDLDRRKEYDCASASKGGRGGKTGPRPAQVVSLEEFEEVNDAVGGEEGDEIWRYQCRCDGVYKITSSDMERGHHLVGCSSCSEVVWVGYELQESDNDDAGSR
ncbi:hypothetical protein H0H87_008731 [Tephrocybe sp. NHM501043]|nr:hypothetical protein H0H87_008731 [Tephrocybe sp. NHM501043]